MERKQEEQRKQGRKKPRRKVKKKDKQKHRQQERERVDVNGTITAFCSQLSSTKLNERLFDFICTSSTNYKPTTDVFI